MKVLMLDAPRSLLEARRRRGQDRWDEVWEGVLHMRRSGRALARRPGPSSLAFVGGSG